MELRGLGPPTTDTGERRSTARVRSFRPLFQSGASSLLLVGEGQGTASPRRAWAVPRRQRGAPVQPEKGKSGPSRQRDRDRERKDRARDHLIGLSALWTNRRRQARAQCQVWPRSLWPRRGGECRLGSEQHFPSIHSPGPDPFHARHKAARDNVPGHSRPGDQALPGPSSQSRTVQGTRKY